MACFCLLVDQKRREKCSKPVAGMCSRCRGGAMVADMVTYTRFCFVPFYCSSYKSIYCVLCGKTLKSYSS